MRHTLMLVSVIGLIAGASGAQAQKLDANGRCHAANGQFAKAEVCGGALRSAAKTTARATARTAAIAPAAVAPPARASEKAKCRTDTGKFAKCGSAGAHPG